MFRPLYSGKTPMRVAVLMSGSGSNAHNLLENAENGRAYMVVAILTDNPASNAAKIAKKYGVAYLKNDLAAFYRQKNRPKTDLSIREEFDRKSVALLRPYAPDVLAYCGYMAIASPVLVDAFLGVNVHPADLSIKNPDGSRRFVGGHAVRDAILAGQKTLCATTHLVSNEVDGGAILLRSAPMRVELPNDFDALDPEQLKNVAAANQKALREKGDWAIFPKTLQFIANGRFALDETGTLYFDGKNVPQGRTVPSVRMQSRYSKP